MRFGSRFQEEIIPEWSEYYVNYSRLKRIIRNSELTGHLFRKEVLNAISEELGKSEKLILQLIDELEHGYKALIAIDPDRPVPRLMCFRKFHPKRLNKTPDTCVSDDSMMSTSYSSGYDAESQSDEHKTTRLFTFLKAPFLLAIGDSKIRPTAKNTAKAQIFECYANAHQLQHFAQLNLEAIRKSLKKLKKYRHIDADYESDLEAELSRSRLTTLTPRLYRLISDISRDYEKKFNEPLDCYVKMDLPQEWGPKWPYIFFAALLFSLVLHAPFLQNNLAAHNCVALFVFVVTLWVTEAIPFFCTAMLIPLVAVRLRIILDRATGTPATYTVASQIIFGNIFSGVQILVMAGLIIGKAFARTSLLMYAIAITHRCTAHRPNMYLLCIMVLSCLLCVFVSNISTPFLMLEVIQSTLWEFPETTNAPHAILLGLAFACNLGGMLSPIASPQNAIATSILSSKNVSFLMWVFVALPIVSFCLLFAWVVILIVWRPFKDIAYIPLQVVNRECVNEVSVLKRTTVLAVSSITLILLLLPTSLSTGGLYMIVLVPMIIFYGVGILSKDDLNNFPWHLVFLLAGGSMLRLCAHDSQMIEHLATSMKHSLTTTPPIVSLVILTLLMGGISTLVSHTVAAMIMLPFINELAPLIPFRSGPFSVTSSSVILLCTLMCSGAMAFPISSFPNIISLLSKSQRGNSYLRAKNFLFCGSLVQLIFTVSLTTWMVPLTNMTLDWWRS